MAVRGEDKRQHIEQWILETNQETASLDKGHISPPSASSSPPPPPLLMKSPVRSTVLFPRSVERGKSPEFGSNSKRPSSPSSSLLFRHSSNSVLLKPRPLQTDTATSNTQYLSVDTVPATVSRSTPNSPSYKPPKRNNLTSCSGLSRSENDLLQSSPTIDALTVCVTDSNIDETSTKKHQQLTTNEDTRDEPFPERATAVDSSTGQGTYVTIKDLTLLSEHIGSKLPLLTTHLGLSLSDWDHACSNYKLPDTQALYVLRLWYNLKDRTIQELVDILETVGLSDIASQLQCGQLKASNKKCSADYAVQKSSATSTAISQRRLRLSHRGFSLQGDDGIPTLMVKTEQTGNRDKLLHIH